MRGFGCAFFSIKGEKIMKSTNSTVELSSYCQKNVIPYRRGEHCSSVKIYKKAFSLFLSLVMLFTITAGLDFSSYAQTDSGTCGDNVTWSLDTSTGKLTISGSGDMINYSYSDAPWYNWCSQIKTVDIQSGVTSIGDGAFDYCSNLTNVTIPNSVTSIGNYAFRFCSSLTSVTIPNSVTSIGYRAFSECSSLTSVTIGNSVTSIGDGAFCGCYDLTSITIPNSVTSIGAYAFENCSSLTSVTIPNSVTSIGNRAFYGCENLISLTMPCSAGSCYDFYNLENLEKVTLTKGTGIMNDSVLKFTSVKEVILENGITNISSWAFSFCENLTDITIPNSVTSIGNRSFSGCKDLINVIIPDSVISIGEYAFQNTPYLDNILRNLTEIHISLDIKESEYYLVDYEYLEKNVLSEIKEKCDNLGINSLVVTNAISYMYRDYSDIHKFIVRFYNDTFDIITLNISYNNSNEYNIKDKEYIDKKLSNAKCPKYFEHDIDSLPRSGIVEYYSGLINDDSVDVCVDAYAGGGNPFSSYVSDGIFVRVFKNDILYYSEMLHGEIYSIPVIYIPNDVKDNEIINYLKKELNSYLKKSEYYKNYKIKSITKGASIREYENGNEYYVNVIDGYTIEYDDYGDGDDYIIVRRKSLSQTKCNHKYKTTTTKATTKKNGSVVTKCSVCGAVKSKSTIYYPKTITLSTTSYTYNGKVKKPSVTVKDSKGKKISSKYYTVSYSKGRKNVGQYTVTIKFKGNYSGTVKKTFTIKPKATTLSKVTAGKKAFTVKWKKQATQTTGYQIQYSTSSKFKGAKTVTVSKNKTTSKKITKLKAKKKYYVRVRTYKTVKVNGKNTKIYSSWSKVKTVKTK